MALTAKLVFENNQAPESNSSAKKYLLKDFSVRVGRSHNDERPDGGPLCDCLELTFIAPDESDLTLYEWFEGQSCMSGYIMFELPTKTGFGFNIKKVLFEDAVCFAMSEEYHIDLKVRRTLHLSIITGKLTIESINVNSDLIWQK